MTRRRLDLEPFDRRLRDDSAGFDDVPRLFSRLVRSGRTGALTTLALGGVLSAMGALGLWLVGPWQPVWYPYWSFASLCLLGAGLYGVEQGLWFLFKPHPLAALPDVKTFVEQLVASPHPVTVCTRCRRLLLGEDVKSCDRCLSASDLFTANSAADHRVIFATLPKDG